MVHCDKCNLEITYLPFRCKYCGRQFCRDHRLPENHGCTGRFDAPIIVPPKMQKDMGIEMEEQERKRPKMKRYQDVEDVDQEKRGARFLRKRQTWFSSSRWRRFEQSKFGQYMATHIFLILFCIGYILSLTPASPYVILSPGYFFFNFCFHTIVTAIFVPDFGVDLFGILFLGIFLFIFNSFGRQLEMRFGRKFLIKLIITCGILKGTVFLLSIALFSLFPGYEAIFRLNIGIGTNFYIFIGVIVFFAVLLPQQTFRIMFLPFPLKAKTVAIIFIAFAVGMGFISWAGYQFEPEASIFLCAGLSELGSALGGFILAKNGRDRIPSRPPPVQFISGY